MIEIITIGDELLIGQVVNTNASWMAEEINGVGWSVRQITSVSDNAEEIRRALEEASLRADVVLMTGGLGPTKDDITKDVLCNYFSTRLVLHEAVLQNIESFFRRKGLPLTGLNRDQAMVPESARVIENPMGTAPGLAFEKDGKLFVAMPGVPYEMKHIMEVFVLPELVKSSDSQVIVHKTILTQGIGESFLAKMIEDWENSLAPDIKLAYLPSPGIVRLRLSMRGTDRMMMEAKIAEKVDELQKLIPVYIWGEGKETLEENVGKLLKERNKTLSTAESCTGGLIAHRITSVPGSSGWFAGSVIAYDNRIKIQMLAVNAEVLEMQGAVSKEVVEEMASGVQKILQTDYAIAVSGIAGPDGGTDEKPVGTVWIAVAGPQGVVSRKFLFGDERMRNIQRSSTAALAMLREQILNVK
ncbi:MAG: competence/damage-inducible protein A [Bacteroidetes bacterium]|nr:MAG: competence/damage-inducible protein A [Bacteroidota bacterium]